MSTLGIYDRASSDTKFSNTVIRWIDYRLPVFTFLHHGLHEYPTPRNLNYLWNFGSLAGIVLVIMIMTGIVLAMHYTPTVGGAFNSVEHIMRDVNYGWLIRFVHTSGASMFFAVVYIHIFRGLYFGSYKAPRELLWGLGVLILLLMMATAFFGYTLPWGQMSFWGATVITNLFSAIPVVGESIVTWLWGGFSVGDPTLNRFYALHYLLPLPLCSCTSLHCIGSAPTTRSASIPRNRRTRSPSIHTTRSRIYSGWRSSWSSMAGSSSTSRMLCSTPTIRYRPIPV